MTKGLTNREQVIINVSDLIYLMEKRINRLDVLIDMSGSEIAIGQIDGQVQTMVEILTRLKQCFPKGAFD
jgi:hypothetical protein